MTGIAIHKKQVQAFNGPVISRFFKVLLLFSTLMFAGCVSVAPNQQRLVSKPNMQFSGSVVFSYHDKLLTQMESGSASFTGGQSGSCGSCVAGGSQ